nr:hypothetical protein [Tanacetum cinerariifolium]
MLKPQSKVIDILCNLELIYPPAFFHIMIHLVIHLPLEAIFGGPILHRWIPETDTYRAKFKSEFPNKDMKEEFPDWFGKQIRQCHVDNDPGVSESSELFALACGPSQTPISVNSCVVNGVSLNDLEIAALHIDDQSIDVDVLPDIIDVVDEDNYIIDEEDPIPHDLADFDDEDLANLDIDDGVNQMFHGVTAVMIVPSIPDTHWLRGLLRELSLHYPSWRQMRSERKAGVVAQIETQFDLRPHMNPIAGHKSMRASRSICKRSTMARRLLLRKGIGFLTRTGLTTWSASYANVPHTFP